MFSFKCSPPGIYVRAPVPPVVKYITKSRPFAPVTSVLIGGLRPENGRIATNVGMGNTGEAYGSWAVYHGRNKAHQLKPG